jgi:hypothetical protein
VNGSSPRGHEETGNGTHGGHVEQVLDPPDEWLAKAERRQEIW